MNKWEKAVFTSQLNDEKAVIAELEKQYRAALKDIDLNIMLLSADQSMQSRVYQLQYQKALRQQVNGILDQLHAKNFTTIQQYLNDCYQTGFIGTMYSMAGQGIPILAPLNQDAMVHAVMTDSKLSAPLYESIGHDIKALKKTVTSEISRGLSSGATWKEIGRNIAFDSGIPMRRAETIARTEGHRIQQEASADARNEAKARGCDVVKQWDSTLDGSTRETHQQLDGQIRETDEPFEVNGKKADYPGGFGDPAEDCNCRCVALTRARWGLDEAELKTMQERAEYFGIDKKDSFEEFKTKYLQAAEYMPLNQTVKITEKDSSSQYSVDRALVNSKAYHDKYEGITGHKAADEAVYQEAMRMLEHRDGTTGEDTALIDTRTGKFITGNRNSTDEGKTGLTRAQYEIAISHTGGMTMVHNHPNGSRASYTDILTMYENPNVDVLIAAGHDGTVHVISDIDREFELAKYWKMVYNECVQEYGDRDVAKIKATDRLYAIGVFKYERR